MQKKKISYMFFWVGVFVCAPMLTATSQVAYIFPWANAGHYAPYNSGPLHGGPQFGEYGHAVYDSKLFLGANPIWDEDQVFESTGISWYDCLEGDYHWKLIVTNLNTENQAEGALLKVYTISGEQADASTLIENDPRLLLETSPASPNGVRWLGAPVNGYYFEIPAGETREITSRDIFNQTVFAESAAGFAQMHATLMLECSAEMETMMVGELSSRPRTHSRGTGTDTSPTSSGLIRHQWGTVQYEGFPTTEYVPNSDEYRMLPYFRTENDDSNEHIGFATAVLLVNPTSSQQTYTLWLCEEDGTPYCSDQSITLAPHEQSYFLASEYLPSEKTPAEGSIHITGESPMAVAVNFRYARRIAEYGWLKVRTDTHAVPFVFMGAAPSATN